jgi:hypothetical protein
MWPAFVNLTSRTPAPFLAIGSTGIHRIDPTLVRFDDIVFVTIAWKTTKVDDGWNGNALQPLNQRLATQRRDGKRPPWARQRLGYPSSGESAPLIVASGSGKPSESSLVR